MPRILFALLPGLTLLLTGCMPGVHLHTGVLSGDQYWSGRVEIHGDVELPADTRLVIAPGSDIVFYPPAPGEDRYTEHPHFIGSELIVHGRISAEGRPDRPIVFRSVSAAAVAGSWGGINVMDSPQADFAYCRFTGANSALHLQETTGRIENSLFRHNQVALRFHSSKLLIAHNRFEANDTAVRFHFGAPVIDGNQFTANRKALFVTAHPADYRIENNNFDRSLDYQVVLGEEVPEDLRAGGNWWGSAKPAQIQAQLFDRRRDPQLGRVLLQPLAEAPFAGAGPQP